MSFQLSRLTRWAHSIEDGYGAVWRYGVAVAAVAVAAIMWPALNVVVGDYALYLHLGLAVTFVALMAGRGPAMAATALSALVADWFFLKPTGSFAIADPEEVWKLGLFVFSATLVSLLVGSLRASILALARAEEVLQQKAQLIDLSHDAVITMDSKRRILTWNKGAEEMYGWPAHDAAGKMLHQLLRTATSIPFTEIDAILHRQRHCEVEFRQTARDGRSLVVDSRQVLLGGEGGLPERILAINRDITERKRIDEALRINEARLEFVLEAANVGAWDLDVSRDAAWRSPQHDAIFGYPALLPHWSRETFMDHVLAEDREEVDQEFRATLATGADFQVECRIRRADGALRWIGIAGRPQRDPQGRALRIGGIVQDISARTKMEEDVRQSEEQFRTLANAIPQICGMADPDGRFFWVNQRFCDYTGLTLEQSKGWGWTAAIDAEASSAALEDWRHSVATGEPFESEFSVRGVDGLARPFLTRGVPVRDRDGRVVRWFGTMTDISKQRRTEEALRKAHAEEQARATELQTIMDAAPVAIFMTRDPEASHILGNRRAYEILRRRPGSNLSRPAPESEKSAAVQMMKDGRAVPEHERPMPKAAATGQAVYDVELEVAFRDGRRANVIGNAVPLLDAEGRSRGAVGIFLDITERKQTEERLRLAQKLESIGLLAGGIAHDFNNLLTVIMGNADVARTLCPGCEPVQHILVSAERAANLTRQLLAYAGKGQFVSETFDLTRLISGCQESLSALVPKNVELRFDLSPEELPFKGDPTQVEQVLINLVINAGEAIPPDTVGRIEIATTTCEVPPDAASEHAPAYDVRPGQFVCLKVSDNGIGMDEATLAQIFDPFYSTKFTGRGLGLAAVQGIVRSCNGFIDVKSSQGAGSQFQVFLPSAATKSAAAAPAAVPYAGSQRPQRASAAILVVDNEDLVLEMACAGLRAAGYQVLEARNGPSALEALAGVAQPPSLVLLDLSMPGMGAGDLVRILRREYPEMRIILTSSYAEEDARSGSPGGVIAGFLQKPYTLSALKDVVEEALRTGGGPGLELPLAA
jgi:two-component system cell cycle sensor histidine kinase/response regulator CckA